MEVIVIGGGLAGLSACIKLAEAGCSVKLISVTKVRRSHSVCAQGGINAAMDTRGEGDSPLIHAYETIKGADFLVDQPPVLEMCTAAPKIIQLLDRWGCPFNRTAEGNLMFRGFGGTLYHRTAFCGASTGQQLLYALDEQVRRFEVKGKIEKFENHEFMRLVRDDEGRACGIVIMDLFNLKIDSLRGDAIVVATGGPGLLFGKSTNSTFCTGAANGRLYMQGMEYANGEFIQVHPTTIPGEDKCRLISESVRGEGGRCWVVGDSSKTITGPDGKEVQCGETGKPWYFFEELYPAYGNIIPRDIGARTMMQVCAAGLGIDGKKQVYLDVTHLPSEVHDRLDSVLEIYEKFTGEDPRKNPMRIYPGVHYSMGGGWVDWPASDAPDRDTRFRQMTNIPGLFNIGESDFQYHGANRLGANSLLSCIFSGLVVGKEVSRYTQSLNHTSKEVSEKCFEKEIALEEAFKEDLMSRDGPENPFSLFDEMGDIMLHNNTVWRNEEGLTACMNKLQEIRERYPKISLPDRGRFANQSYLFTNRVKSMLELALAITKSALMRKESRGAHFRTDYPEHDDNFLKTSIATWHSDEPRITYKEVDMPYLEPLARDYVTAKKSKPHFKNLPEKLDLPL